MVSGNVSYQINMCLLLEKINYCQAITSCSLLLRHSCLSCTAPFKQDIYTNCPESSCGNVLLYRFVFAYNQGTVKLLNRYLPLLQEKKEADV